MSPHRIPNPGRGRRLSLRLVVASVALAMLSSACGAEETSAGSPAAELLADGAAVVVANSPGALSTNGPQRVLVAIVGNGPERMLGGPDTPAVIEFTSPDGGVVDEVDAEWIANPDSALGMYVTQYTFPTSGSWEIDILGNDGAGFSVQVGDESTVPDIGDEAPRSDSPTAASLEEATVISTDPEPALRFYQQTVAEAVTDGKPTVVVFATPAFCQTAACGPTLELVKQVADNHPAVDFVHVEPYDIDKARDGELVTVPLLEEWNLPSEPWVFVVDDAGLIAASFEGLVTADEIDAALDRL